MNANLVKRSWNKTQISLKEKNEKKKSKKITKRHKFRQKIQILLKIYEENASLVSGVYPPSTLTFQKILYHPESSLHDL